MPVLPVDYPGSNSHFENLSWRLRWRMSEGQGCKQVVPRGENKEDCDGSQPFEEAAACCCLVDGLEPKVIGEFSDGVEGEGEQVEGGEDCGTGGYKISRNSHFWQRWSAVVSNFE